MTEGRLAYSKGVRTPEARKAWADYHRNRRQEGRAAVGELERLKADLAAALAREEQLKVHIISARDLLSWVLPWAGPIRRLRIKDFLDKVKA